MRGDKPAKDVPLAASSEDVAEQGGGQVVELIGEDRRALNVLGEKLSDELRKNPVWSRFMKANRE